MTIMISLIRKIITYCKKILPLQSGNCDVQGTYLSDYKEQWYKH